MFEAILFDLDGTLLDIDMDFFLTKYFEEIGRMAVDKVQCEPRRLVEQILLSTDVMIRDLNPDTRNEEVFMGDFISSLGTDEQPMRKFFDEFYLTRFPLLQGYCKPFDIVPDIMEAAFNQDIKVVIATNSVFPLRAIQCRLEWAGVGNYPYELLTCYENMHYCKPHWQYYQEIIQQIGVDPHRCLMVGNDTREDLAAEMIGIKTFLVEDRLIDRGNSPYSAYRQGNLNDLFKFIKQMTKA
ncbi:MAG: HAD family hydrolase [Syntrophomonas sp.]|nr:HAD family hydrolase [Syntrophomonas sp.]